MKCITKQMLFDFTKNELTSEQRVAIQQHLAQCATCRIELKKINEKLALVQNSIQNLNDVAVVVPKFAHHAPQNAFIEKIRFRYQRHQKLIYATKIAVVTAVLFLCLFMNQHRARISGNPEKIHRALSNWEQYFEPNPKKDWNEQRFIMSVYHPQSNTVEYIQNSINSGEVKKIKINLNEIEQK